MLTESRGNMYSWITHTWNTIKGECPHGCTYCYMGRYGKQRPVRFDKKELETDLGSGNFIFVGSSCDIFAENLPPAWLNATLMHCSKYDNQYLFQSKNPVKFVQKYFLLPQFTRLCTTIETNRVYPQMGLTLHPKDRAVMLGSIITIEKYVTIEPIMYFDLRELVELIKLCNPVQVNIGADSGNNNLPEPPKDKILELIDELKKFTFIDQKRNLQRLLK